MPVLSRRRVLEPTSLGFGRVVLSHLLADVGLASPPGLGAALRSLPTTISKHGKAISPPGRKP